MTEAYVNRREMARILGVAVSTLDKLVAQGEVPSVTWGLRTRRFLPSEVIDALGDVVSAPSVVALDDERQKRRAA